MDPISTNPPSYPINKALSAYGKTPRVAKPGGTPYATQTAGVQRTSPTQRTNPTDTVGKISPSPMAQRANSINKLLGGKVQPMELGSDVAQIKGPRPTVTSAGTYTMYPQAADRVQAATNIASNANPGMGRALDIRG